jgi:hypothetical protein
MKYYKNKNNEAFIFNEDGSQDDLINDKIKITEEEFLVIMNNVENIRTRVQQAKAYLEATDFKMTVDYDEDATEVKLKRKEAREFIRANENKE